MHYKNGRAAKNGDPVVLIQTGVLPVAGILAQATPGNDTCNGIILVPNGPTFYSPDLRNVLHMDDIAAATIPDSTVGKAADPALAPAENA